MNLRRVTRKPNSTAPRAARQRRGSTAEVQLREFGEAVNFPLMSVRSGDGIYQQQDPRLVAGEVFPQQGGLVGIPGGIVTTCSLAAPRGLGLHKIVVPRSAAARGTTWRHNMKANGDPEHGEAPTVSCGLKCQVSGQEAGRRSA